TPPPQLEGKPLEKLLRRIRVAQRPQQVTVNGPAVTLQKRPPSFAHSLPLAAVRFQDHGPHGLDAADPVVEIIAIHWQPPAASVVTDILTDLGRVASA